MHRIQNTPVNERFSHIYQIMKVQVIITFMKTDMSIFCVVTEYQNEMELQVE